MKKGKKVWRKVRKRKRKKHLWCDVATLLVSHSFWFIQYHFNGTLVAIYYSNIYQRCNLLRQSTKWFFGLSQLFVQNRCLFNYNRIYRMKGLTTQPDNYDSEMCAYDLALFVATHSVAFSSATHTWKRTHTHTHIWIYLESLTFNSNDKKKHTTK